MNNPKDDLHQYCSEEIYSRVDADIGVDLVHTLGDYLADTLIAADGEVTPTLVANVIQEWTDATVTARSYAVAYDVTRRLQHLPQDAATYYQELDWDDEEVQLLVWTTRRVRADAKAEAAECGLTLRDYVNHLLTTDLYEDTL